MNPSEILRIVDAIHRDKNIDKEIVFQAIESALVSAARKNYGDDAEIIINIDRKDGSIDGSSDGVALDPEETVGRIGAQTAKQVIIQKIREAERDSLFEEYQEQMGQLVGGVVQRNEGRATFCDQQRWNASSLFHGCQGKSQLGWRQRYLDQSRQYLRHRQSA